MNEIIMLKKTIIHLVLGATLLGAMVTSPTGYAASKKTDHSFKGDVTVTITTPEVANPTTTENEASAVSEKQVTMALVTELYSQFVDDNYGIQANHLATGVGLQNAFKAIGMNTTSVSFKLDLDTIEVLGKQAMASIQLRDLVDISVITPSSISTDGVITFDTTSLLQASDQEEPFYRYQVEFDFTGEPLQALGLFQFAVYA